MNAKFRFIWVICLVLALLFSQRLLAQGGFLMGEDVIHPSGMILTVNEINRSPFQSGLGNQVKQDEIRVNLTLVNTGMSTIRVDPAADFSIELEKAYRQTPDPEKKAMDKPFNVFPSTQSRIDLYFKVPADDTYEPVLLFVYEESDVRVFCSSELERLAEKAAAQNLSSADAVRLARFYVDAGRFSAAQGIIEAALQVDPQSNQLWMLMAAVHEGNYDNDAAAECLGRVNPSLITSYEEATALARQALNLGHYRLAIAVLEPYELINKLEPDSRVTLARAYYYEEDLPRAERILVQMQRDGVRDRLIPFTLGNIRDRQESLAEAISYWEQALTIDSEYCEAYFNIGVGFYKQNKIDKAREYWQKVLQYRPDSVIQRATQDALASTE